MQFLCRNIVAISVGATLSVVAWLFGGARAGELLRVLPWLLFIVLEAFLIFPQPHEMETTHQARSRVWKRLRKDPLVLIMGATLVILAIPFMNCGLCNVCDYPKILLGANPRPPLPFLPFCVNRLEHLNVFLWFLGAFTLVAAVRYGCLKSGKRLVLHIVVWNGVALAVLGGIQIMYEIPGPLGQTFGAAKLDHFFSTFGYSNMAGCYFSTLFALAVGLWRWEFEKVRELEKKEADRIQAPSSFRFWNRHYMLIAAVILFFAAMNTLSRASIMLSSSMAVVFFAHAAASFLKRMSRARRFKASAVCALVFVVLALLVVRYMPKDVRAEVDTIETRAVLDRVSGKYQCEQRAALAILKDSPVFGCGGWGFVHFSAEKLSQREKSNFEYAWGRVGRANVHNDWLQFAAEHGLVVLGLILAVVYLLISPVGRVWRALYAAVCFTKTKEQPPHPHALFVIPAPAFCILVAAGAVVIHSFGDCPLRSAAVSMLFFTMLAAIDGFLPRVEDAPVKTATREKERHHHHHASR